MKRKQPDNTSRPRGRKSSKAELGDACVEPDRSFAGRKGRWIICYRAGTAGIKQGGGLRIVPPDAALVRWETGKVLAFCSNPSVSLEVRTEKVSPMSYHHSHYPAIIVHVWGADLANRDEIRVEMGAIGGYLSGRFLQARAQLHAGPALFRVFVDPKGYGNRSRERMKPDAYREVKGRLTVNIEPADAAGVRCVVRDCPAQGKDHPGVLAIEDEFENPITASEYPIRLFVEKGAAAVPERIVKKAGESGVKFRAKCPGDEITWIGASCWNRNIYGVSNPVCPNFTRKGHRIYFGDTHVMTGASCGFGDPEEAIKYARDVFGLDFTTVSDTGDLSYWPGHRKLFKRYNKNHEFVTLPGYERNLGGAGHKNVYYLDEDLPAYSGKDLQELWKFLAGKECMAISHHINIHSESDPDNWGPLDISSINPRYEKLIEICQNRGSFEKDEIGGEVIFGGFGSSVRDVLQRGYRLGFAGGTDTHRARPGSRRSNQSGVDSAFAEATGGITAVLCEELTRECVWNALKARRCYATTSERILLDFELNGHQMGEDVSVASCGSKRFNIRELFIRAAGTAELEQVVIVRNGVEIAAIPAGTMEFETAWTDNAGLADIHDSGIGGCYYYIKIRQVDGNMAWSSPVWLTY